MKKEHKVYMYLRKSRADEELEKELAIDTLIKHEKILVEYAAKNNITITKTFKEVVSGDRLMDRTEMVAMLKMLEDNHNIDGVLCMEIDRLGRGDMEEQGYILKVFKENNMLIFTPRKIYDLHNEFDEEYTEFETFMARKELKIINRRLQRGRLSSVKEGNYIATHAPTRLQDSL